MRTLPAKLCDVCIEPGACCKGFVINQENGVVAYWLEEATPLHLLVDMAKRFLPFLPDRQSEVYDKEGRPYVYWWIKCPELLPTGRCGSYEQRPDICRNYEPASSALCVYGRL